MRELTEHERQVMESALKRSTKLVAKGALSEPKAELDRLVKCRNYQTSVGPGWATVCLTLPEKSEKAHIADLREWLRLIDKQLSRLEEEGI